MKLEREGHTLPQTPSEHWPRVLINHARREEAGIVAIPLLPHPPQPALNPHHHHPHPLNIAAPALTPVIPQHSPPQPFTPPHLAMRRRGGAVWSPLAHTGSHPPVHPLPHIPAHLPRTPSQQHDGSDVGAAIDHVNEASNATECDNADDDMPVYNYDWMFDC